jgi:hypothetical protein
VSKAQPARRKRKVDRVETNSAAEMSLLSQYCPPYECGGTWKLRWCAMALPKPNNHGFLDPSSDPYAGTLADLHQRFVVESPNHNELRQRVFTALELHLSLLSDIGGPAKVWVNGGFITFKAAPPHDVDLVYLCRDESHMGHMLRSDGIYELLTLQNVIVGSPAAGGLAKVQPVGGLVDAFLAVRRPRTCTGRRCGQG